MKLKFYVKPIDVNVSPHFDIIKHMLSNPILHSQIEKCALALTKYSLTYIPLKAMKRHVLADFIVDHATVEIPQNYLELEPWKLDFDGSSHENGTDIRILVISPNKILKKFKYKIYDSCSNNEPEYEALIADLKILFNFGSKKSQDRGRL